MKKILFITNVPAPYTVKFFELLSQKVELTVIYERRTASNREAEWFNQYSTNYKEIFLHGIPYGAEASFSFGILTYLNNNYDLIIVGNYASPTGILSIFYMNLFKIPFYIHVDGGIIASKEGVKKYIKSYLMSSAKGFFSPGKVTDRYINYYAGKDKMIKHYNFSSILQKEIHFDIFDNERKKQLLRKLEENIAVKDTDLVIVAIGSIIHRKGFDILLKALTKINKEVQVFIVGGKANEFFMSYMKKYGINNVHFVGFKDQHQVREYLNASDLFVLPTRYDIWGLVVNEALAAGVPVVTSDRCVAGLELVRKDYNGYIFKTEDFEDLASCISLFAEKTVEERKDMSLNALKVASDYTIEKMVSMYFDAIEEYLV